MSASNPDLVHALRGGIVESFHRGALAIVDADGRLVTSLGDVDRPIFSRSACKLLQALPLVASGAAEAFGLDDAELAMACASHSGEPAHVATVARVLAKAGLAGSALECGAHWPYADSAIKSMARAGDVPTALHNNCSGKHAGFVCVGCLMARAAGREPAEFVRGYSRPDHPVMREVTAALAAATGADLATAPVGTDGCSIPTYAIPLRQLAHGFARVATGVGLRGDHARAAKRLRQAVAASPFHVGGTLKFDSRVMQRLGQRVCCKVGAEGVYCAALPDQGLGVAIKLDDGNTARAAEVVMAAVIEALVPLAADEPAFMRGFSDAALVNWNGIEVGRLQRQASMHCLNKLAGFQRSAPGLEWALWRRLPALLGWSTALPGLLAALLWLAAPDVADTAAERDQCLLIYRLIGAVLLHWSLMLMLAIGCVIVMLMKGPAYVADAYPPPGRDRLR